MTKRRKFFTFRYISIILAVLAGLTGCTNNNTQQEYNDKTQEQSSTHPAPEPIKTLYKTIDVEITEIKCIWRDNRGASFNVSYKSDEYGVSNSMYNISNWTGLGYDLERKLKEGDIIQATLYSTAQGENVLERRLGNIIN